MNAAPADGERWSAATFWFLLLGSSVLRGILAAALPLSGDEVYYWDCSRHPDWCTYDQPSLIIWSMIPFRALLGETALAVRMPALLASLLVGVFLERLIRRLGGGYREGSIAYLVLHATPMFVVGSGYASTDALMNAAYLAAAWAAVAIAQGERRAWWGFGAAVGIGFLAKYPIVTVLPVLVPILMKREARAHLRTPTPWLAALFCLALTAPVWIWGAQHDWINVTFQFSRVPEGFDPLNLLGFWGANLLMFTPFIGVALAVAWVLACRRREPGWGTYCVAAAGAIGFFSVMALRGHVGAHWGAPSLVTSIAALVLVRFRGRRGLILAGAVTTAVAVPVMMTVFLVPYSWLRAEIRFREATGRPDKVELVELFGREEIAAEVARRLRPGELAATEDYSDVHGVAFLSGGETPTRLCHQGGRHGLASLYWYLPSELAGRDFLFFTEEPEIHLQIGPLFAEIVEEEPLEIVVEGRVLRTVRFLRCKTLLEPHPWFTQLDE